MPKSLFAFAIVLASFSGLAQKKHYPEISFDQMGNHSLDTVEFKAVVKDVYECPPCPQGAECKPCIGNHITVTDGSSGSTTLTVFTQHPLALKPGRRYRLRIRFGNPAHRLDSIELVAIVK